MILGHFKHFKYNKNRRELRIPLCPTLNYQVNFHLFPKQTFNTHNDHDIIKITYDKQRGEIMTITLDESKLKKLVNNAVMGILDTLRMTKKEENFESLPLCHYSIKPYFRQFQKIIFQTMPTL